jgi:hypothetical protein
MLESQATSPHSNRSLCTCAGLLYYGSTREAPYPRLIAYHPSVPLHLALNKTVFQVMLRGLAQVGLSSAQVHAPGCQTQQCTLIPDLPVSASRTD